MSAKSIRSTTDQFVKDLDVPPPATLDIFRPIKLGKIYNQPFSASANFFQDNRAPKNPPCTVRLYIAIDTGGGLIQLQRADSSKPTTYTTETLNGGLVLGANVAYILDVIIDTGEEFNYIYTVTATVLKASVVELDAMTG